MNIDLVHAKAIFLQAAEQTSAASREALLAKACGGDSELRQHVESLLAAHEQAGSFLEQGALAREATLDQTPLERPATQIGPYKLLQQIGEGGMGVVYMAEQTVPIERRVALKIIKPGMDTRQVIARFAAEKQALALMDHVNIARVLDAGVTEQGRPYFVMELVHGVPITKYCDDNYLTPRQRLELFVPVCQAIQHAHQKGIIHRDIKPSNVMITLYDGKPVPKVIDFGVAKATEQKLTEQTLFTQYGTMIGTLEYMSPEQAESSALGVDTRSDIYSLGVLLYELLTGSTPLSRQQMKEAAYGEILRLIRDVEPPKPSTRLSESGESLASISAQRHTEPAKLSKLMRGELDWIVMKTLEKDRNRRYETANGFAADVQRYLNDEPVQACPPSAIYRFRKFARRNHRILITAFVILLALIAGTAVSTRQAFRATHAEGLAEERLKTANANYETAEAQRGRAEASEREAKTKEALAKEAQKQSAESLKDAVAAVDQMLTRVGQERLVNVPQMEPVRRELLQDAVKFYRRFLEKNSDDPLIRRETALAYLRLAEIHRNLGQYVEAETDYGQAFAMFEELQGKVPLEPHIRRDLCTAYLQRANTVSLLGKGQEQEKYLRQAVEIAEQLVNEYPNDSNNAGALVDATVYLAGLTASTQPEEAEKLLRRNLTITNTAYFRANTHRYLGYLLTGQGRLREAEQATRQALDEYEKIATTNPSSIPTWVQLYLGETLQHLAALVAADGRLQEAEKSSARAITILDKLATDYPAGPDHRHCQAMAHQGRASLLQKLGRTAEAEKTYRRALDLFEKLAADFPTINEYRQTAFNQRLNFGQFLVEAGRADDALGVYRQAVDLSGKLAADAPTKLNHWQGLVRTHVKLGRLLAKSGKQEEAETTYRQAAEIQEKLEHDFADKPEYRRELALSHFRAAQQLEEAGRLSDSDKLYLWALNHYGDVARESPQAKQSLEELAHLHLGLGGHHLFGAGPARLKVAERSFQGALEIFEMLAQQFPETLDYRARVADCHICLAFAAQDEGRIQQAEQRLRQGIPLAESIAKELPSDGEVRLRLGKGYRSLAEILSAAAPPHEVEEALARSLAVLEKVVADFPDKEWYIAELGLTCSSLAEHQFRNGRTDEGRRLYGRVVELCEQMLTNRPDGAVVNTAWWLNSNAWFLVRRADGTPRGVQLAVEMAKRAVAREPQGHIVNTLGTAYYRAGEWQLAADTLLRSVELLGSSHLSANAFFLAMAQEKLGAKDDARKWYTVALVWMEKREANNEELIRFRGEAAALLGLTENSADLAPQLEEVVEWTRKQPAPVASQLAWLAAELYELDQQFAKAEPLYREALEHIRQQYGAGDARAAGLLAILCRNLLQQQKYADAEPLARECLAIREKAQPESWTTFNVKSMLGGCLLGQKQFAVAEPLLLAGYEGMKQREGSIPPISKPRLTEAIQRLAQLYDDWGQPETAAQWRKKLIEK